jgi:flagellar protein FliL
MTENKYFQVLVLGSTRRYNVGTGLKSKLLSIPKVLYHPLVGGVKNMATNAHQESTPLKKQGLSLQKILLGVLVLLNLVTVVGGGVAVYMLKSGGSAPAITEEKESSALSADREIRGDKPVLFTFDPFTINLDGRPRKLVRTTIQLEMLSEEGFEEAVDLTPVERDQIVKILNTKKFEDIETIQGKLFLKDQIMTAMNGILHKAMVKEVYFNEFIVQ